MLAERMKQGIALQDAGRIDDAARTFEGIVGEDPGIADAWHRLGEIAARRLDLEKAERFTLKAVELEPRNPGFRTNLATIYARLGRFDAAEAEYRHVLGVAPDFANAYYNLVSIKEFDQDEDFIGSLRAQLKNDSIKGKRRGLLHFAAAKYCDQTGDYDAAFEHCRLGNTAWRARFSPQDFWSEIEAQTEVFDADLFARHGAGPEPAPGGGRQVPVFVVGMPRSGTSLVEQIIASHPEIDGAGELPDVASIVTAIPKHAPEGRPYPACLPDLPDHVIAGFAEAYLDRLRKLAPAARMVVNKTTTNYRHLGLIALLFPNARIIHCRRDPLDTCLSCYFHLFDGGFHDYSCDLWHLGFVHRCYRRLMAHWSRVLPIEIFDLRYEDLVADQDGPIRELVNFCGVDWDPACAEFHRSTRPVHTSSMRQVRRPIYKGSVGRWRHYERHLGPLLDALGPLED